MIKHDRERSDAAQGIKLNNADGFGLAAHRTQWL
jgi:hypothetical protein